MEIKKKKKRKKKESPPSPLSGFSLTDSNDAQDSRRREGRGPSFILLFHFHPAHKYSDLYLQLCMWDDYPVFSIATLVFTRLLLDKIYHLTNDAKFVCLLDGLILGFYYSNLTWETSGFELKSIITQQANQLTKCDQPRIN